MAIYLGVSMIYKGIYLFRNSIRKWIKKPETKSTESAYFEFYKNFFTNNRGGGRLKILVWQALANLLNIGMVDCGRW